MRRTPACRRGAVQKARTSGRLVLHADGSIDAAASDARRAQATDPSMQRGRRQTVVAPGARKPPSARCQRDAARAGLARSVSRRRHGRVSGREGVTYLQARTANEVLKAQERRIRLQTLKGEVVDRARAGAGTGVPPRPAGAGRLGRLAGAGRGDDGRRSRDRRARGCRAVLEAHVRQHLGELADLRADSSNELVDGDLQVSLGFDGAENFLRAWRGGLTPDSDYRLGLGRQASGAELARRLGGGAVADKPDALPAGDNGRAVAVASVSAGRVHEMFAGRRHRKRRQLDRLRHPSRAGADAGGAAVGRAGQALFAAACCRRSSPAASW